MKKLQYLWLALNEQYIRAIRKVNLPMFTPVKMQCVFGEEQIEQILKHCEHIFSVVDIWHVNVAEEVLLVFSQVFRDVNVFISEDEPENEDTVDFSHWI